MLQSDRRRKRPKLNQRARIWSHEIKEAAGQGVGSSLMGRPISAPGEGEVRSWLEAPAMRAVYETLRDRVREYSQERRGESVPQADCFALFALTKAIGARTALEIGTNLGFSTLHIAAALSENGSPAKLTTVDIVDVNDEVAARYKSFGASISARERLRALGLEDRVEFVVSPSETFLKRTRDTYDMIFVDGDHSEVGSYFDIMWSLLRLSEHGIIVLHDFNDPYDPTEGGRLGQYGVYWAIHRLRSYIPEIGVIRLRSLMPPGIASAVPTSLAVVTRLQPQH